MSHQGNKVRLSKQQCSHQMLRPVLYDEARLSCGCVEALPQTVRARAADCASGRPAMMRVRFRWDRIWIRHAGMTEKRSAPAPKPLVFVCEMTSRCSSAVDGIRPGSIFTLIKDGPVVNLSPRGHAPRAGHALHLMRDGAGHFGLVALYRDSASAVCIAKSPLFMFIPLSPHRYSY